MTPTKNNVVAVSVLLLAFLLFGCSNPEPTVPLGHRYVTEITYTFDIVEANGKRTNFEIKTVWNSTVDIECQPVDPMPPPQGNQSNTIPFNSTITITTSFKDIMRPTLDGKTACFLGFHQQQNQYKHPPEKNEPRSVVFNEGLEL